MNATTTTRKGEKMTSEVSNIQVWLDSTSDPDDPTWIVSDESEGCSDVLSDHDTEAEALLAAFELVGHSLIRCDVCNVYVDGSSGHCPQCESPV